MKKIMSVVTCLVIFFSFNTNSAYAYQQEMGSITEKALALVSDINIAEELQNAREGIIDSSVCQEVLDRISVTSNDDNDVLYTVRHLGSIATGEVYTITASSTKTSNGSTTEDNVECWISMTWIDNWGPSNEIVDVSGGWSANGRTLSNRQVLYGVAQMDGAYIDGMYECQDLSDDVFFCIPSTPLVGFSLKANSWVDIDGYSKTIYCGVKSSVLD